MNKKVITIVFMVIIFGLPIGWYLFLQAFGENQFELPVIGQWDHTCISPVEATVVVDSSISRGNRNEFSRITKRMKTSSGHLSLTYVNKDKCGLEHDVYLIDEQQRIRGVFDLTREEVDRFLAEVDIYIYNQNNAKSN